MNKELTNKQKLEELANKMGLEDKAILTGQIQETTNKPYFQLVNNQRRFVKGLLSLPVAEQNARIVELTRIVEEQEALEAAKAQG